MTVIGITGGTGAGKTTALEAVRQLGGVILDCDVIYHELLESDQQLLGQIRAHFPDAFPDGKFDRKALGAIVFQDPGALADLTAITGRYVCQEVQGRLAEYEAQGVALAAIDAIGLFESGLAASCDVTVAITAPRELRAERIMARDHISREYALLRIDAQKSDRYFADHCDRVIENDGTMTREEFTAKCLNIFSQYTA